MPTLYDRVLETSLTTGAGTYTLAGAVAGYQTFGVVGNGATAYYTAWEVDANGVPTGNWEVGSGVYTVSGTTLTRAAIAASSNGGAAVSWGAGTKRIALTLSADLANLLTVTTGTGALVRATSPTLVTPSITTSATITRDAIGATSTDGLIVQNTTPAAAGAQQWSPRIHLIGQGWKTTATAASQTVEWIAEVVPVQGAANPTSTLVFSSQVNGGGYTQALAAGGSNGLGGGPQLAVGSGSGASAGIILGNYASGVSGLWHTIAAPTTTNYIIAGNATNMGFNAGTTLFLNIADVTQLQLAVGQAKMPSAMLFGWTAGNTGGALDTIQARDAPNTLALRNATAAQRQNIYNTFTATLTAGEWWKMDWQGTANQFRMGAVKGSSSGTARVASWDYGDALASATAAITVPITSGPIVFGGGITTAGPVVHAANYLELTEMTAPAAGATNNVRLYAEDSGGKTRIMALFPTGAAVQIAIEP